MIKASDVNSEIGDKKMEKIFQRFSLNLEEMDRLSMEQMAELDPPEAGKRIKIELLARGYTVLESNEGYGGLPCDIIIGSDITKINHKRDFDEVAGNLRGMYGSKECYFQTGQRGD